MSARNSRALQWFRFKHGFLARNSHYPLLFLILLFPLNNHTPQENEREKVNGVHTRLCGYRANGLFGTQNDIPFVALVGVSVPDPCNRDISNVLPVVGTW